MAEYRVIPHRGKFAVEWYDASGKRCRRSLGTSDRTQIESEVRRIVAEVAHENRDRGAKLEEIWTGYVQSIAHKPAARPAGFQWRAMSKHFGPLFPEELTESAVAKYVQARREQGISNGTLATELGRLRTALKWGERKGLVTTRLPYVPLPPKPSPRDKRLTREEALKFLDACHMSHMKLFVTLALATGARMGALLDLKWEQVDLDASRIDLEGQGTGLRRKGRAVVPINSWARAALLKAFEKRTNCPYVINWAGQRIKTVKEGIEKTGKRCGLPWVTAHVFRHSVASWMAEDKVSMPEIARFLGHKNSRITEEVYAKFSPDYLQGAARSMDFSQLGTASSDTDTNPVAQSGTESDQTQNAEIVDFEGYQRLKR